MGFAYWINPSIRRVIEFSMLIHGNEAFHAKYFKFF